MRSPVIELHDVAFSYGDVAALKNIELEIADGEFLGVVGPNAGGKSTLLKLILGLLEPQRGAVSVLGRSPKNGRASIGYVPQYPHFSRDFPISVEQVVLQGRLGTGRFWGRYSAADHAAAARVLAEAEAEAGHLARRPIGSLSGGQLQRVLLARALVSEPRILILDEPTANIDQRGENDIFDRLKLLNERMTIIVVSHDIAFISAYVQRVACLNRTLVCHNTDAIDADTINELYGENVRMVAHSHSHGHGH